MTFEQVISIIENKRRFGKAFGRDVTMELMEQLGHPEMGMDIIHIAGTNGKGSVAAFVSSILQAASFASDEPYKVGVFTSPHLVDFTERIMIDGKPIPKEDARRIGQMLLELDLKLEPTMFDYCLAMAMIYYKEQGVKYVVLETGLGGSKDSTAGLSVIPKVCAITSIGLEHTQILGDTIEEIAAEKAGIIKAGTQCAIGQMDENASDVIGAVCAEYDVPLFFAEPEDANVPLGLFGSYQRKNAGLARLIANILGVDDDVINQGLKNARWPGRMDLISKDPFILLDGAHNPHGVKALHDSLRLEFPEEKFTFIMAVMADKDYVEMAQIMSDIAARVYTCTVDYNRALEPAALADALKNIGMDAKAFDSYEDAIDLACENKEKVIVFGSLYFIGEVLKKKKCLIEKI